jgi:hypothetical protein
MGPVERELREKTTIWDIGQEQGGAAFRVLKGAANNLAGCSVNLFTAQGEGWLGDAWSEAIEAAEALGL